MHWAKGMANPGTATEMTTDNRQQTTDAYATASSAIRTVSQGRASPPGVGGDGRAGRGRRERAERQGSRLRAWSAGTPRRCMQVIRMWRSPPSSSATGEVCGTAWPPHPRRVSEEDTRCKSGYPYWLCPNRTLASCVLLLPVLHLVVLRAARCLSGPFSHSGRKLRE